METLTRADRRLADALALLTFAVYAYFYAGGGWNQNSQFDLTRAIVERRTFAIDAYAFNTGDVSRHGGHVYSNKTPGLSWVAALPYAFLHFVETRAGLDPGNPHVLTINNYLCTVATVGVLGAAIPAMLYLYGRRRGVDAKWCALVALTVAFATQLFPYSTLLMLHVPSGALMLAALVARRDETSGFFAGAATAMNYLCAPAVLVFAFLRERKLRYLLGAVPPILALVAYQWICFGSPFATVFSRFDDRFVTEGAAYGLFIGPTPEAVWGITFSPYRGLFFFAPILLPAVFEVFQWSRRRLGGGNVRHRVGGGSTGRAIAALVAIFFVVNASFNGWEGGFGIGARYLVPLIPLLGVAMLEVQRKKLFAALAAISFAINFTAAAVDPQPSGTIPRPLTQYLVPLLIRGEFSPRVPITPPWSAATFTGHTSVNRFAHDEAIVFRRHPPGDPVGEWASFNLGEPLFGAGDPRSLIPVLLLLAAGGFAIVRRAARVQRESAATAPPPP